MGVSSGYGAADCNALLVPQPSQCLAWHGEIGSGIHCPTIRLFMVIWFVVSYLLYLALVT